MRLAHLRVGGNQKRLQRANRQDVALVALGQSGRLVHVVRAERAAVELALKQKPKLSVRQAVERERLRVRGELALRLLHHRAVEREVRETLVRPPTHVLQQRRGLARPRERAHEHHLVVAHLRGDHRELLVRELATPARAPGRGVRARELDGARRLLDVRQPRQPREVHLRRERKHPGAFPPRRARHRRHQQVGELVEVQTRAQLRHHADFGGVRGARLRRAFGALEQETHGGRVVHRRERRQRQQRPAVVFHETPRREFAHRRRQARARRRAELGERAIRV